MRLLIFILTIPLFINASCQKYLGSIKRVSYYADTAISFTGKQVVFIGNSITDGYVTTNRATDNWPQLFCQIVGATQIGMGISGQVLQNSYACGRTMFDVTTIPTKGTKAGLFISLGTNDLGLNNSVFTSATYKLKLDSVVQHAVNVKGWHYNDIVLVTPYYMSQAGYDSYVGQCGTTTAANVTRHEAYVQAVKDIAISRHTVLADIYTPTRDNPLYRSNYMADGIHPNNAGHQYIATWMSSLVFKQQ